MLLFPLSVFGHTNLTGSTPEEGEVVTEALKTVQLDFGTSIEEGSTMNLESETGSIDFEQVEVSEQSMTGTLSEELPNGAYTVNWSIIGADGHPIEGKVPFAVDLETAEAEEEPAEEPLEEPVIEPADEEPVAEESSPGQGQAADNEAEEEAGGSNLLVTILLAIAFILLVFGLFKLFGKKR